MPGNLNSVLRMENEGYVGALKMEEKVAAFHGFSCP